MTGNVSFSALLSPRLTSCCYRAILNLAMPYSSQHEITAAVEAAVVEGLDSGNPITEQDVEKQLMTSRVNSPPVDILIRTSGVKRLSDFLTWQVRFVLPTACVRWSHWFQVFGRYADTILPQVLARVWSLGFHAYPVRLSGQNLVFKIILLQP